MTTDADWRDPVWAKMPSKTSIETVNDHLALAFECNRQLRAENADYRAALESVSNMVPAGSHESFIIDTVLAKYAQPIPCTDKP